MSATQPEVMIRSEFYFDLDAVGVFDLMSLGTGMASQWSHTETGRPIFNLIQTEFQKVFEDDVYLLIERMELYNDNNQKIQLGILVNAQGVLAQNRSLKHLTDWIAEIDRSICDLYEAASHGKLMADFDYYETTQLNRMN